MHLLIKIKISPLLATAFKLSVICEPIITSWHNTPTISETSLWHSHPWGWFHCDGRSLCRCSWCGRTGVLANHMLYSVDGRNLTWVVPAHLCSSPKASITQITVTHCWLVGLNTEKKQMQWPIQCFCSHCNVANLLTKSGLWHLTDCKVCHCCFRLTFLLNLELYISLALLQFGAFAS